MHVVEIVRLGNGRIDRFTQLGRRHVIEAELHRPDGRRGDGEQEIVGARTLGADHEDGRAPEMGERGAAEGEALGERPGSGRWMLRSSSPA